MRKFSIFIPTKDRPNVLLKYMKKNYDKRCHWIIGLEKQDEKKYDLFFNIFPKIEKIVYENNQGIGYARKMGAIHSYLRNDIISFQMDDNVNIKGDWFDFYDKMMSIKSLYFCGGYKSIYDLFYKMNLFPDNALVKEHNIPAICFGFKTEVIKKINFDEKLKYHYSEDDDFGMMLECLCGINSVYIYKGFKFDKKRFENGGGRSVESLEGFKKTVKYLNEKYGFEIFKIMKNGKIRKSLVKFMKNFEEIKKNLIQKGFIK